MALSKDWDRGRGIICGHFCSLPHLVMETDKNWTTPAPTAFQPGRGRVKIPLYKKRTPSSRMKFILVGYDILECQHKKSCNSFIK